MNFISEQATRCVRYKPAKCYCKFLRCRKCRFRENKLQLNLHTCVAIGYQQLQGIACGEGIRLSLNAHFYVLKLQIISLFITLNQNSYYRITFCTCNKSWTKKRVCVGVVRLLSAITCFDIRRQLRFGWSARLVFCNFSRQILNNFQKFECVFIY